METLVEKQRVRAKSNPQFVGVVTRVAYEGTVGFVHFDVAEEGEEVYFAAAELDPE